MVMYIRSVYGGWVVVWWWWYWYGMVWYRIIKAADTKKDVYTYFFTCMYTYSLENSMVLSSYYGSDLTGEFGRTLWQDRHCRIPLLDTPFGTITMAARG